MRPFYDARPSAVSITTILKTLPMPRSILDRFNVSHCPKIVQTIHHVTHGNTAIIRQGFLIQLLSFIIRQTFVISKFSIHSDLYILMLKENLKQYHSLQNKHSEIHLMLEISNKVSKFVNNITSTLSRGKLTTKSLSLFC